MERSWLSMTRGLARWDLPARVTLRVVGGWTSGPVKHANRPQRRSRPRDGAPGPAFGVRCTRRTACRLGGTSVVTLLDGGGGSNRLLVISRDVTVQQDTERA